MECSLATLDYFEVNNPAELLLLAFVLFYLSMHIPQKL